MCRSRPRDMLRTESSPTMAGFGSSSMVRGVQGHWGLEPELVCAVDRDRDCSSPSSDRADSTLLERSGIDLDSRLSLSRRDPECVLFCCCCCCSWLCWRESLLLLLLSGLVRDLAWGATQKVSRFQSRQLRFSSRLPSSMKSAHRENTTPAH